MTNPQSSNYEHQKLYNIPLDELQPDPKQPRKHFNEESLEELSASIQSKGVLHPVIFRLENGQKILISGERRYRASKMAGLETIPAIYWEGGNSAELSLIENLVREDLTPVEEAEALAQIQKDFGYTLEQMSKILGKAISTISESLKLNKLSDKIKDDCREDKELPRRILLEIAKTSEEEQLDLFKRARKKDITSEQIRALTRKRSKNRDRVNVFTERLNQISSYANKFIDEDINYNEKRKIITEIKTLQEKMNEILSKLESK